jgi:integrase
MQTTANIGSVCAIPSQQATRLSRKLENNGPQLTYPSNDYEAVSVWLADFAGNCNTLSSFRREAERLLLWAKWKGKDLSALAVDDLLAYEVFLSDPQPVEMWCLQTEPKALSSGEPNPKWRRVRRVPKLLKDGTNNPAWRPFESGLSAAAAKLSMTILFGMFETLAVIRYLSGNPLRPLRAIGKKSRATTTERYFDDAAWSCIQRWIDGMPRETLRESSHYSRVRFIFRFLYYTGLRRFEFANAMTNDLRLENGGWWLRVPGKDDVESAVPLPDGALEELKLYRESTGRPALPLLGVSEPLLMDITGKGIEPVSDRLIYATIKDVCRRAAESISSELPMLAAHIRRGSTQWIRRTAAAAQLNNGVDLVCVQMNLRCSSMNTMMNFVDRATAPENRKTSSARNSIGLNCDP